MPVDWSSRLLEAAVYDRSQAILELSFRSGISYRYWNVPAQVYHRLLQAESKGKFYNVHIYAIATYTKMPANPRLEPAPLQNLMR